MFYAGDTNIYIGFSFCPDSFFKSSNKFIPKNLDKLYWTSYVKEEYERKFKDLSECRLWNYNIQYNKNH